MASPVVLSPRPNPPGAKVPPARTLALPSHGSKPSKSPAAAAMPTSGPGGMDLAEQMNDQVRSQFVMGAKLGEGTYAIVWQAHYRDNPKHVVAIKKIKVNAEYPNGIAPDAIREMQFLFELSHPNVIKLHAVFSSRDQNLSLVLEHLPRGDLEQLWKNKEITYTKADIKAWMNMMCQGIWFCHENYVLHRDIKGSNALIAADGTVKIADFGLARSFADPGTKMTTMVITRMYRPLELLYGCSHYGGTADMWSIGVLMAELCKRDWFLYSDTDIRQVSVICEKFGTPTEDTWPGVSALPYYVAPDKQTGPQGTTAFRQTRPRSWWKQEFPTLGDDGCDFIKGLLTLDPQKRYTARKALEDKWWANAPRPTKKENLPKEGGGPKAMGEDLKRRGGETPTNGRADKVARKLDFGSMG
ncbi:SPS1 Serine threonine protein kinase [Pyrenophora tritici-repentis]|uniref:SPS1, Serine-threonine protein kinase n=2 Tax=Pyrenophora tritici-repentis TaxID=45151 RepID=A0A2W1F656_9PLEO|nr:Serine/threonine-protein kinase crk1 [Pyrenophora tritici-repentis]KAF7442610.1 Serine/threonine-protein kinase crk1 [Pyrenophora tritici-repentis]KAF7579014.1 SPS1, Serine-threonine protein kinase [Pyrenophora tritici-repentis]KAG9377947.1 Serine/threonine-protein kinase crk1 [Pyrenophora tritici-repentis]KAI0587290.1 Serine/threonine-protein kinase crk1 [Pyrenophora tritici-repentis]